MEELNEKVTWKTLLLAFGLYVGGKYATSKFVSNYTEYKFLKNIYNQVNSKSSIPTKDENAKVEEIRRSIISSIEKSNRENKQYIIDSVKSINFKVVDTLGKSDNDADVAACYIYLKPMKKHFVNNFLVEPSQDNIIILTKQSLNNDDISMYVVHEFNHYIDKLMGKDDSDYSEDINIKQYLDNKAITDKQYAINKLGYIYTSGAKFGTDFNKFKLEDHDKKILSGIYDSFKKDVNYYTTPTEVFVRYKQLKDGFVKAGLIKDINEPLDIEMFSKYFSLKHGKKFTQRSYQDFQLLLWLDLSKLKELDKVVL